MTFLAVALLASGAQAFPAVEGLVSRLLPRHKNQIVLKDIRSTGQEGEERFSYWTDPDGKLVLEGNTPIAQASALGWYLRHSARVAPFWEGFDASSLPDRLPAAKGKVTQRTPYRHRVYLNFCTLSYTAAYWDWKRWEYEIDLMALQGINMPLQPIGLEGVWYHMLQRPEVGFTEQEARAFLVGPAHFAWQWMTNIEGYGGPLPKVFIDDHIILGKKILDREIAFGMHPIQQGFTGFVPLLMKKKFPRANIRQQPPWCGTFRGSAQLDPLDPLFPKLAKLFYAEQKRLFGLHGFYATDPFHESAPPRRGNDYLENVGKTIFSSAVEADPGATLCIQSWSIRMPIVKVIPKEHVLVLDIGSRWPAAKSFDGYPFVAGTIHNFGGRTRMFGNLRGTAGNGFLNALKRNPNCVGMGLFPEGIHSDPAYFSLIFDQIWREKPTDFPSWIKDYVTARYGKDIPEAHEAWALLCKTVYGGRQGMTSSLIAARPALNVKKSDLSRYFAINYDPRDLLQAWKLLLRASSEARGPGYAFDVADVGRQLMGDVLHALHANVINAYLDRDERKLKAATDTFTAFALDMDKLCGTVPFLSFEKWVQDARSLPGNNADKERYDANATVQLTQWGYNVKCTILFDYAWKEWSGLIRDYYVPRWQRLHSGLFKTLREGTVWPDEDKICSKSLGRPELRATPFYSALADWECEWINKPHIAYPPYRPGDPVKESERILAKWHTVIGDNVKINPRDNLRSARFRISSKQLNSSLGKIIRRWNPSLCSPTQWRVWEIDVTRLMDGNGDYEVSFTYTRGGARLDIAEVSLLQNGVAVSTDTHPGTAGDKNRDNSYRLRHEDPIIGATFAIRVKAKTHGPDRSYGVVQLKHLP